MEAVILDLDDTLIVEQAAARRSVAEALAVVEVTDSDGAVVDAALACARRHWQGSGFYATCGRLGIASWEGLWATFEGCHRSLDGLADWASAYRQAAWADILGLFGADVERSEEVAQRYIGAQRRGHPPIESAIDAAGKFAATMPTGVLTNGPPDIQRRKLAQTGLAVADDVVVISAEVGFGKPEPAAFSLALDMLGARAAGAVMVGDSWERDIVGSLAVGMRAVWVSKGRRPPADLDGVLIVDELSPATFDALT
ncbi:MAG: HAD family hydrolase [Acidimicrobiales bacterium]